MTQLNALQTWLQAQLTGQTGGQQPEALDEIIRTNGVHPEQRLRVYTSGYFLRLLECLQGDFPLLRAFLSERVFDLFARGYIYTIGSQSYSLLDFSKKFPAFLLQMSPPAQSEEEWDRYRFPYELACVERMMIEVATDRGFENETPQKNANTLDSIWMGFHSDLQVETPACLRLLEAHFDLFAFIDDPQPTEVRNLPLRNKTFLVLHRRNYHLQKHQLEPWQYHFLSQIHSGNTFLHHALEKTALLTQKNLSELQAALLFFLPFCEEQQLLRRIS